MERIFGWCETCNKEEMNKWIYSGLLMAGLIVGMAIGFILCNTLVVKPIKASYQWQAKEANKMISTLAATPKSLIENTLVVKKVKKGSTISYVPSSDMRVIEWKNNIDSLISITQFPEDTVATEKSWWEKLKFW